MILVDIGNSGLRAARAEQIGLGVTVDRSEIFKLSWSSIGKEILKHQPQRSSICLLYTSPSPRDVEESRMPSSA